MKERRERIQLWRRAGQSCGSVRPPLLIGTLLCAALAIGIAFWISAKKTKLPAQAGAGIAAESAPSAESPGTAGTAGEEPVSGPALETKLADLPPAPRRTVP